MARLENLDGWPRYHAPRLPPMRMPEEPRPPAWLLPLERSVKSGCDYCHSRTHD